MPSFSSQQVELLLRINLILMEITNILDNLFFMRLELEDGAIPIFPPEPVFDSMKTIGKYE
jgi:hypothetical protein